jgi:tetratricopeptide (TPR) repeat protein
MSRLAECAVVTNLTTRAPARTAVFIAACALLSGSLLLAQDAGEESIGAEAKPLIDRAPFDIIVLTATAGGHQVPIAPLENRNINPRPSDATKLQVVLLSHEDRRYEIAWRDIERVDLYEQMIYDEAVKKMGEKDFIGAFQNLSFLMRNYPRMPNLEKLQRDFMFQSATTLFNEGKLLQTMSTLEELKRLAPSFNTATVNTGLSRVADAIIRQHIENDDLLSAQQVLGRLERQHGDDLPAVSKWKGELKKMADSRREDAVALMEQGNYREARKAAVAALSIFPDAEGGQALLEEITRRHPMLRVGVMQRAGELDPSSLLNWPARRTGSLVQRPLFEFLQTGTEGGRYGFALGTYRQSDDRQQLMLTLEPEAIGIMPPTALAQQLLLRATPGHPAYDASWGAIVKSVSVPGAAQVLVELQRPNVLPHALLQYTLRDPEGNELLPGVYQPGSADDVENSYLIRERTEGALQPVEIVERFYADPKEAFNDLLRGEIDVLDQLYPADARRLATSNKVRVGSYALPTVHMLVPISDNPYLAKDKYRRALLYATNRKGILEGELLGGADVRDGRIISGPFPLGIDGNDPLSYAYNTSVEPVKYDPQLAKLLLVMVDEEFQSAQTKFQTPVPPKKTLRLAVPDYELARVAAQALIQQWMIVGVQAEMVVLPPGQDLSSISDCDLVYATASIWEPATDIERLLGGGSLAASDNPFIVRGLSRLRSARNWREVRDALQDLHRLVRYHLPILPLWQVTDRFAYSSKLEGLQSGSINLYQNVAEWRHQSLQSAPTGQPRTAATTSTPAP